MGLETATFVSDLVNTNPTSGDNRSQGDDHLRLVKAAVQATFPNAGKAFRFPDSVNKSSNYTVLSTDQNKIITVDASGGGVSLTLPSLAAGDAGWQIWIIKTDSGTNDVLANGTINGSGAGLRVSRQHAAILVWWTGSAFFGLTTRPFPIALTELDINGATDLTAPASDDRLPIYDLSATANRDIALTDFFKVIAGFTAETAVASGDLVLIYDVSASAVRVMTPANLARQNQLPTRQTLLSGSGATYTTPAGCRMIRVRMIGGGGGGAASASGNGGAGGTTSFSSFTAVGGAGGTAGSATGGGAGGSGGSGSADLRLVGGRGGTCTGTQNFVTGGGGGVSPFGGAGQGQLNAAGTAAQSNTGSGGGGGGASSGTCGPGGGAGEYVEFTISSPAANYTYTIGDGGTAGTTSGNAGAAGGSGIIIVEELY